jgi:hypothetical protein
MAWKRFMARKHLALLAAAVVVLGVVACSHLAEEASGPGRAKAGGAATTSAPAHVATSAKKKVALTRVLSIESSGEDVKRLQQRLKDLAFDPGPADGQYGPATRASVWAYQKLVTGVPRAEASGEVTPQLWNRMQDAMVVSPLRPNASATHLEVYLPQQVAVLFAGNAPRLITHMSSGSGEKWCEKGFCSVAVTPGGTFKFGQREEGWQDALLGQLFNPVYFNYSEAVHGAYNVPLSPVSHGCVRIPMHIAKYFQTLVHTGDQVFVFDGVKDPEEYGAQPPPFNAIDPDATTTTQATTTTTSSSSSEARRPTTSSSSTPPPRSTTTAATTLAPTTRPAAVTSTTRKKP